MVVNDRLGGDPINPAGAEERRRVERFAAYRVEIAPFNRVTGAAHLGAAGHNREEPRKLSLFLLQLFGDGERMDDASLHLRNAGGRMDLKAIDVLAGRSAAAHAALEMAFDATACIEDRSQAIALPRQGVVLGPFVLKEHPALGDLF